MELYVKLDDGANERFELIQAIPSNQIMKIMVDHDFIRKQLPNATPQNVFEILKLAWSVANLQDAVANLQDAVASYTKRE